MADVDTATAPRRRPVSSGTRPSWVLVLLWLDGRPQRVGEVAFVPDDTLAVLGRGPARRDDPGPRLLVGPHLPGGDPAGAPIAAPAISRRQLELRASGAQHLRVRNVGRCPLFVNGRAVAEADVGVGAVLELQNQAMFLVTRRSPDLAGRAEEHTYGRADPAGFVGESPVAWALRARVEFAGPRPAHVLVTGPSGAGKELVARGLHLASPRSGKALVARNAATLPSGLVDAELFGNAANYPNPGMRERPGLVGLADASTLFLDEIGELPEETQAHLLRVLDDGEYHRLGDGRPRRSDLRLVVATNRDPESLKQDLLARLVLRIDVPGLDDRREDVPLIAQQLLRRIGQEDPDAVVRFFRNGDVYGYARVTPRLVRALVQHPYDTHVRELLALLWRAIEQSDGDTLDVEAVPTAPPDEPRDPNDVTRDEIVAALRDNDGAIRKTAEALRLSSRHVLARLMKKHGLTS